VTLISVTLTLLHSPLTIPATDLQFAVTALRFTHSVTLTLQHDLDIHHDLDLRDLDLITLIFDPAATSLQFAVMALRFTHPATLTLQYDLDIHHDLDLRDLDLITLIFDPAATSLPFAVIPLNGIGFDWFTHSVTLTLTRCHMTLTLSATLTVLLRDGISFVDQ